MQTQIIRICRICYKLSVYIKYNHAIIVYNKNVSILSLTELLFQLVKGFIEQHDIRAYSKHQKNKNEVHSLSKD
ncbi:hypothetical protein Cassandra_0358 [Pseudomonas phage Cassandra]|nr:hypothetical protein Cassandra_0358 [Pseudomonas phage Cassandra]